MKAKLELELLNVFGGDGVTRIEQIEETKLKRTTTKSRTRADVGVSVESKSGETVKQLVDKEINTFDKNKDGNPTLRLGGVHGKFWGVMKEAGISLAEFGKTFPSKAAVTRLMKMVNVFPMEIELEDPSEMELKKLPQILNSIGNSMIEQYFDVIGECKAELTIEFPEEVKEQILDMLKQIEKMSCLNKRRGKITISNLEDIEHQFDA